MGTDRVSSKESMGEIRNRSSSRGQNIARSINISCDGLRGTYDTSNAVAPDDVTRQQRSR